MNLVVDDIGLVVAAMRESVELESLFDILPTGADPTKIPFYDYGHRLEIAQKLLSKKEGKVFTYSKYPLIALRLDIPEEVSSGFIHYTLNLGIYAFTNKNYTTQQRYEHVFKPILYPLYDSFFQKLYESGLFSWDIKDLERPPHIKIDRPFWGTPSEEKNEANIFNDPLDAIEIINLKINSKLKC